jgi:hypothetical protein
VPSVELFPIHHLDELEYFPGDFVLPQNAGMSGLHQILAEIKLLDLCK